jgi:Flp pilus assembly protein TadD
VAAAAALVVWPWGLADARATWRATGLANEARRWERFADAASIARAEAMYRQALTVDPTQATVWQSLARVLLRQGRDAEAESLLTDGALRAQPAHVVERDLIALLLRRGKGDAALPRLAQYLRDRPTDAEMLHTYAVALEQAGQGGEALAAARQLIAAAPDDPQGYVDLGVLLARAGRREEARAAFTRGLQRRPGDANLRRNLDLLGPAPSPGSAAPAPR